jgi:hypothetical protein
MLDFQYEIRLRPISGGGYLTYGRTAGNPICVLDARSGGAVYHTVDTILGPVTVYYKGYREKIEEQAATNNIMYYGGRPTQGAVESLAAVEYSTTGYIAPGLYNTTTGGSGSGLKVNAASYFNCNSRTKRYSNNRLRYPLATYRCVRSTLSRCSGPTLDTNEAVFTHPATGNTITVSMSLTSQVLNITGFNAGYIG